MLARHIENIDDLIKVLYYKNTIKSDLGRHDFWWSHNNTNKSTRSFRPIFKSGNFREISICIDNIDGFLQQYRIDRSIPIPTKCLIDYRYIYPKYRYKYRRRHTNQALLTRSTVLWVMQSKDIRGLKRRKGTTTFFICNTVCVPMLLFCSQAFVALSVALTLCAKKARFAHQHPKKSF